jgi:predicted amidohydrolase
LTVAGLCVTPRPWDKQGNFAKLELFVKKAAVDGAQLVVTPEGFLEGYLWQDDDPQEFTREEYLGVGESVDGEFVVRAASLAGEQGIYLGLGFAERQGDLMYNSLALFGPSGDLISLHRKCHTADDETFNEKGTELQVIETPFGPWGVLICMDRQPPEAMRVLALKGAQLVIVPAWGMCGEMNDAMMRTRAYENGVYVLFVHPRRCLIIDPGGKVVAEDIGQVDSVVQAEIMLADFSELSPIQYRRPELYGEITRRP